MKRITNLRIVGTGIAQAGRREEHFGEQISNEEALTASSRVPHRLPARLEDGEREAGIQIRCKEWI
jgi:hypothetical protein